MIHVCFGLHDKSGRYSKFVGATMASIFENTAADVTIHILHDATLSDANRDNFSYLAGRYAQHVKFHNVEKICPEEIKFIKEKLAAKIKLRFSIGAFYRLMMKKILAPHGVDKAIYLDADIIVNLDIGELWRHDLKNFSVAAVPEDKATLGFMIANKYVINKKLVAKENYFCSGVLMFNLAALDENFFRNGVQFLVDNPQCESPDQDILNAFFSANYLKLEQKFDSFVQSDRLRKLPLAKKIYHYAGQCIELKFDDAYNKLFMEHFVRTPWFDFGFVDRIGKAFRKMTDEHTLHVQRMLRLAVEHKRAFFVTSNNVNAIKILFSVQDDELIIKTDNPFMVNELVTKMRELRGKKLFFICQPNYDDYKRMLYTLGFREFIDFANGMVFMTKEQCGFMRVERDLINDM